MGRNSEKPALLEKCEELGIETKSADSVADLKAKIAEKEGAPVEEEAPIEEAPAEELDALEEEAPAEEEPEDLGELPKKIEGSDILSINKVGDLYQIQAANGCGYTLAEAEYKALS